MTSRVLVSIALPYSDDREEDLRVFQRLWVALVEKNLSFASSGGVAGVMLLSRASNPILQPALSEVFSKTRPDVAVSSFTGDSWGEILNHTFVHVLASEAASYWVHLDDLHICARPFWHSAASVLSGPGRHLWQLLLIPPQDEDYSRAHAVKGDGYTQLVPYPEEEDCGESGPYPLVSLRPCVYNLHHFRQAVRRRHLARTPFCKDEDWDYMEWSFGCELDRLGATVGLIDPPVFQQLEEQDANM